VILHMQALNLLTQGRTDQLHSWGAAGAAAGAANKAQGNRGSSARGVDPLLAPGLELGHLATQAEAAGPAG
jgi:hypothetical protein